MSGSCLSTTSGWSMYPLLRDRRDTVVLAPVKGRLYKYDMPLYRRPDGSYVLHRILEVRPEGYVLCGDNQLVREFPVPQKWMIGVVTGIYRDEKELKLDSRKYRFYVRLWCSSLGVRKFLLKGVRGWDKVRRKLRRERN